MARVGEHVNFEACMDIMDLLYEKEEFLDLFNTSNCLAASILARLFYFSWFRTDWSSIFFNIPSWVCHCLCRLPRMLLQFLYKGGSSLFSLGVRLWDCIFIDPFYFDFWAHFTFSPQLLWGCYILSYPFSFAPLHHWLSFACTSSPLFKFISFHGLIKKANM